MQLTRTTTASASAATRAASSTARPLVAAVTMLAPRTHHQRDQRRGASVLARAEMDWAKAAGELLGKAKDAIAGTDPNQVKAAAAGAYNTSAAALKQCADAAMAAFGKYDKDGDGKLSIAEAVALLNSDEVSGAVTKATGLPHTQRTEADIQKWFGRADFDKSGTLSKREFAVMYLGLLADKAKVGAGGMATALCAALDSDGDGKIGSSELKRLLGSTGLSVLSSIAAIVPEGKDIDYRSLLSKL